MFSESDSFCRRRSVGSSSTSIWAYARIMELLQEAYDQALEFSVWVGGGILVIALLMIVINARRRYRRGYYDR